MGDGGLGIGGAHVLSTCRRNVGLTLLVLNNFNYGMTGGQCSSTTPPEAQVGSGFLNRLEKPIDICQVAGTAGAGYVARLSTYQKDLPEQIEAAIRFDGFSLIDIWGLEPMPEPEHIEVRFTPMQTERQEVVILGSAGQRIVTAGEILCLAGITAGLHACQKNDYPITVLRGHSVSELILSKEDIGYPGIENPSVVIALAHEGVNRRRSMFGHLPKETLLIKAKGIDLPDCDNDVIEIDFKAHRIKPQDLALASLALMALQNKVLSVEMLKAALGIRFKASVLEGSLALVEMVDSINMA
ncbi:MAG: hypothetical protein B6I22_13960 [Desulfobacteraceae bacterium 4572_123]|nr:MAG: hypothetical protein B6I22_13960 [Desulfobacteraceae bacterium 4572_123]